MKSHTTPPTHLLRLSHHPTTLAPSQNLTTSYPPTLEKRKRSANDKETERYHRGADSESPKRIKTGAIKEKGDVKTNIPILDLDPFMDTDPSMTGFKTVQIEAFKGDFGPLDEYSRSLSTYSPTEPSFPTAMLAANAMKFRLETTASTGSATSDAVSLSSIATNAPIMIVTLGGGPNIPAETNGPVNITKSEDVSYALDDISSTPSHVSQTPYDVSSTPVQKSAVVSTTTSDNTSNFSAEKYVHADSSFGKGASEGISSPLIETRARTNTVASDPILSYPTEVSLPLNTVESDDLQSLPDYESDSPQPTPKLPREGFEWPQSNPNEITHDYIDNGGPFGRGSYSIMTESSGSEGGESSQSSSLESSLDRGLENPRYPLAITGAPQCFNKLNSHRVQEWVGTAQVDTNWNPAALEMTPGQQWEQRPQGHSDSDDELMMRQKNHHEEEMERRQGCIQRGEGYTYYPFDQTGTLWADQEDIIHETVNHGMEVLTSVFIPSGSKQASNQVAITGRGHQELETDGAAEDDESDFNNLEEAIKIARRRPRSYPEFRSGAEAIMDARFNRSSTRSQLAIKNLTRSVSQHSGGVSFNETAGSNSAYAGQSGTGASRDDPIDLTKSPISHKRKNRSEDSQLRLPPISSLIAQTTPRHTREIKHARLEKVAARANFPVFVEPHPDVDWIRLVPAPYVTLNHGHIKENIDESMTTDLHVQRWFQTNEGRRDQMLFLRDGPAPEEEDEDEDEEWGRRDVPGRDAELEAQFERVRYYNRGYMPR